MRRLIANTVQKDYKENILDTIKKLKVGILDCQTKLEDFLDGTDYNTSDDVFDMKMIIGESIDKMNDDLEKKYKKVSQYEIGVIEYTPTLYDRMKLVKMIYDIGDLPDFTKVDLKKYLQDKFGISIIDDKYIPYKYENVQDYYDLHCKSCE